MKIGFVGTGIMGAPMAIHLQSAGHEIRLFKHRTTLPAELLQNGAVECSSLAQLARESDAVISILPDTPDVESAIFGSGGLAEGMPSGAILVDMSSICPMATQDFAAKLAEAGVQFVDAPVSGGEIGARNATLTIMAGGASDAYARAHPLFALMGQHITHVGPVGHGQIAKLTNQIIVALTIQAVSEGLLFASRAGADASIVRKALMGGFASSRILEVHGQRMVEREFDPGFRIGLHNKDLNIALANARTMGLALPATASAQQMFNACIGLGGEAWDHSGMIRALEAMSGHAIDSSN